MGGSADASSRGATIDGVAGTLTLFYTPDSPDTTHPRVRSTDPGGFVVETTFTVDVVYPQGLLIVEACGR